MKYNVTTYDFMRYDVKKYDIVKYDVIKYDIIKYEVMKCDMDTIPGYQSQISATGHSDYVTGHRPCNNL